AAGRPARQVQKAHQGRLAGAGRAGQEVEGAGGEIKVNVAQDLGPEAVPQANVLETHHEDASFNTARVAKEGPSMARAPQARQGAAASLLSAWPCHAYKIRQIPAARRGFSSGWA